MSFLLCAPSVCVVENEYQILLAVKEYGTVCVKIGDEFFYEENSGVLCSQKRNFKISLPKKTLDKEKEYTVVYRKVIERKKYFSVVEDVVEETFSFKPLEKTVNINAYHLADIHKRFELAKSAVKYFGDDLDILIVNGDIAEVDTEEDYFEVLNFLGEIGEGKIPMIFSRGNHDTRGKLAERFTDFFPSVGKKTYFDFEIGPIGGIVLDCGEDKIESHEVYADLNRFDLYRKNQTEFLKKHERSDKKYYFAVCHIPPCKTTVHLGDEFDIERETYETWCKELERIGASFIISGHLHKAFIVEKEDETKTCPCNIPLIVGSALFRPEEILWGSAITFKEKSILIRFTDDSMVVHLEYEIRV